MLKKLLAMAAVSAAGLYVYKKFAGANSDIENRIPMYGDNPVPTEDDNQLPTALDSILTSIDDMMTTSIDTVSSTADEILGMAAEPAAEPVDNSLNDDQSDYHFYRPASEPVASQSPANNAARNRQAFLDMIAYSEGTANAGANGYRMMFGGALCNNLDDHPRQIFSFTNRRGETLKTSAAGRYQFLSRTWDELANKLGLPDFSESSQDSACLELIRRCGALPYVDKGDIQTSINRCAKTWASLPGAGYAQPERKLSSLLAAYNASGGVTT